MNDTAPTTETTPPKLRAGLLFSANELKVVCLAVERLAADYRTQGEDLAQGRAADLLQRLTDYGSDKSGISAERGKKFSVAFMQASAQSPVKAHAVLADWWQALLQEEADPAGTLAPMLVQMMQGAGNQTAVGILAASGRKLAAIESRSGTSPSLVEFGNWIALGVEQARKGQPLWPDDPDLAPPHEPKAE